MNIYVSSELWEIVNSILIGCLAITSITQSIRITRVKRKLENKMQWMTACISHTTLPASDPRK